jgi:exodeoxyribonuclease VII small subunit
MANRKAAAGSGPAPDPEELGFEAALERLQTIVDELEGGRLSLEDSIARYEEGIKLSRRLTQTLDEAEKRIERLVESQNERGTPATEPMEVEPGDEESPGGPPENSAARPRAAARAAPRRPAPPEPDELPF